jgi:hypothetical protein
MTDKLAKLDQARKCLEDAAKLERGANELESEGFAWDALRIKAKSALEGVQYESIIKGGAVNALRGRAIELQREAQSIINEIAGSENQTGVPVLIHQGTNDPQTSMIGQGCGGPVDARDCV